MPSAKAQGFSEELVLQLVVEHLSFEQGQALTWCSWVSSTYPKAKDWKVCDPDNSHYLLKN